MQLTKKELIALENTDFLLTKSKVILKIYSLMENIRNELKNMIKLSNFSFPQGVDTETGKISKGENYLNLPYMVLDYPSLFLSDDVFAYRTMFWWGNFFSYTLHLEGKSLEKFRTAIAGNIDTLIEQKIFIGVGETPWQYHYEKHNYVLLTKIRKDYISNHNFLKLSKKIDIGEWKSAPKYSVNFLELLLALLKT